MHVTVGKESHVLLASDPWELHNSAPVGWPPRTYYQASIHVDRERYGFLLRYDVEPASDEDEDESSELNPQTRHCLQPNDWGLCAVINALPHDYWTAGCDGGLFWDAIEEHIL